MLESFITAFIVYFVVIDPIACGAGGYNLSYNSIRRPCGPWYAQFNWLWCTWCGDGNNRHDSHLAEVFSRVTAIILAAPSVQYFIDDILELILSASIKSNAHALQEKNFEKKNVWLQ